MLPRKLSQAPSRKVCKLESESLCVAIYSISPLIINCFYVGLMVVGRPLRLPITFFRFEKVAIFTTNVDAENQTLINHKCVCGALNRHFCQTRVICGFLKSNYVSIKLGKKLHCHLDIYSLFYSDVRNVNTKPFIFLENKVL
jgi:hypothetical protein